LINFAGKRTKTGEAAIRASMKRKKVIPILTALCFAFYLCHAQFSAGGNDTINPGVPVVLTATYGEIGIPVSGMGDDEVKGPFPIGFSFMFFGNIYTQFYVGANGWISFSPNVTSAGIRDPFAVPSMVNTNPKNCILGPFCDLQPDNSSSFIFYLTLGEPPNRELVVMWCQTPLYSTQECPGQFATFQIILEENGNEIENQILSKPQCATNYKGTIGLQNSTGTIGFAAPGRNATSWAATMEGWHYTPVSVDSFAVASVPYHLVPMTPGNRINYAWYQGSDLIDYSQSIVVAPMETTVYTVKMNLCDGEEFDTTVTVVVLPTIPNAFSPNGDGINDELRIIGLPPENITRYNLQIFNRWGQVVFTSTNILDSWDGTLNGQKCPDGVYCWVIYYEDNKKAKVTNKGTVVLVK
jgi:gliding motility-associated-like protein